MAPAVAAEIGHFDENASIPIRSRTRSGMRPSGGRSPSDAEVAEIGYTVITGRLTAEHRPVIVRRVRGLHPASAPPGQSELFATVR